MVQFERNDWYQGFALEAAEELPNARITVEKRPLQCRVSCVKSVRASECA